MYCFIILFRLISSFLQTRSLLVSCAYVSIESIDCILLSSFELKAILLIFKQKHYAFPLLNLCCAYNISLLFIMNSLRLSTSILFFSQWLILFSIWAASKHFTILMTIFKFSFYNTPFCVCCFFIFIIVVFLNSYLFFLSIQQIISWFVHLIYLSLV